MHDPQRCPPRPLRRPIALALSLLLGSIGLTGTLLPATAMAQVAPTHRFDIPAGPLAAALNQAGAISGVLLSFDPTLVANRRSPGLNGSFSIEEGLHRLLSGSGLGVTRRDDGSYMLHRLPDAPAGTAVLSAVRVIGITEGTGSYTTNLSNTATKLDLSLRETPQSITVMTRKRMEDQGLDEISKVLDQTTGLYFNNTNVVGGDSNAIYSRGFELQNYQVDGVPRSHRFGFKNDIADTAIFDRVEVVRGASGLLNGVGEPSGAVNLVRKLPTAEFQAHVAAKYGSWDFYRVEADLGGPLTETGNVRGRMVAVHQDNGMFVDRVEMEKQIFYGIVEVDLTPATILSAGVEYQQHETSGAGSLFSGAPIFFLDGSRTGFGPSTNIAADWSSTQRDNLTLFAGLEHYFDNDWKIRLDLEHSRRKYDITIGDVSLNYASAGNVGSFRGFKYYGEPTQNSATLHATGPYRLFGRTHELVMGGSYYEMKEDGKNHHRMDTLIPDYAELFRLIGTGHYPRGDMSPTGAGSTLRDWQSGLYAATRLSVTDDVSLIIGSRLSNWKTRTDRFTAAGITTRGKTSKESSVVTPYAGIVVDLGDHLSVYASYTDIFQPSTRSDANGNLLDPAEGSNLEAGFKLAFFEDRLNLSAAMYRTKKDNVPEYVPGPGGSVNRGPTGEYVYEGIDGTKTTGFELEIAGELTPEWQIASGFSHAKPVDANGKPRLTYIPRKTLKLFTSYQVLEDLTLGANLRWQNAISSSSPRPYSQSSVATLDLMAHYVISRQLSATLNFNNVFDKRYYTNINSGGWYGEPRSAYLNLRYSF
ncbi:TonB-dependent siderophore receptor [Thauera sp. SDU_THAU2]|uniref:TonB-dependent siderophore receptor n=1 Tax=Thauera sp. SDU_THAU2 TaxID=3136633 RepID=UPI00311F5DBB